MTVLSAGMEKHTWITEAVFCQFWRQFLDIQETVDIIIHCSCVTSLAAVFKNHRGVFGIQRNVRGLIRTQINLLLLQSPMADNDFSDLGIVAVQPIGKEDSGQSRPYIFVLGIYTELLIYYGKIFVDPAFFDLLKGKFFHIVPVSVISFLIKLLIPDHIAVYKSFFIIT